MIRGEFDLRKTLRAGVIAGVVLVFIAAVGMVEGFNGRLVVHPILSLGFLALYWYVPVAAYKVGDEQVLEGQVAAEKTWMHVVAGALVGLIGGVMLWLLVVITDTLDLRDVFTRLSPRLVDILTFDQGVGTGLVIIVATTVTLGLIGGALHLVPAIWRKRVIVGSQAVIVVALTEDITTQVMRTIGLDGSVTTVFRNNALRLAPAIVIFLLGVALAGRKTGIPEFTKRHLTVDDPKLRTRNSAVAALIVLVIVAVTPWVLGSLLSELLANVAIFMLLALGLNIVVGFAGLLDLGYVAFFAVGAYTTGVLTSPISPWEALPTVSWWWTLPVVVVVAAIAGILVGTPVIRMRGDYLAIVTLGFGEIVRISFLSDWLGPYFGAAGGVRNIPGIPLGFDTISGADPEYMMYFAFALVLLAAWVSWALLNSRVGRAWIAMREDESVAEVMGIDTTRSKLLAFVVGAILAGLGGALFAAKLGSIFPTSFSLLVSIIILVVVIVGGMGSLVGVAAGAVVLIGVLGGPNQPGLLAEFSEFKLLIYGAVLIYMMLKRPEGLVPSVRRQRELHVEELTQDAWFDKKGEFADVGEEA
jgi:branched-chain amino acid transport system permease protein